MATTEKYRNVVREVALDNYGYVTTRAAAEAGVPPIEMPKLAQRGGLENIAYGLYRVPFVPVHDLNQYAEAVLRAGNGAFLRAESVLAMFGLADVNPRRIKVGVRRRARADFPQFMEVARADANARTTRYEGIESQLVEDALLECRGRVENTRLMDAAREARDRGLLTGAQLRRVRKALKP